VASRYRVSAAWVVVLGEGSGRVGDGATVVGVGWGGAEVGGLAVGL